MELKDFSSPINHWEKTPQTIITMPGTTGAKPSSPIKQLIFTPPISPIITTTKKIPSWLNVLSIISISELLNTLPPPTLKTMPPSNKPFHLDKSLDSEISPKLANTETQKEDLLPLMLFKVLSFLPTSFMLKLEAFRNIFPSPFPETTKTWTKPSQKCLPNLKKLKSTRTALLSSTLTLLIPTPEALLRHTGYLVKSPENKETVSTFSPLITLCSDFKSKKFLKKLKKIKTKSRRVSTEKN